MKFIHSVITYIMLIKFINLRFCEFRKENNDKDYHEIKNFNSYYLLKSNMVKFLECYKSDFTTLLI